MLTRAYTLRFTTPAFLGNAQQQAQWRTPPIKALLRQWWRVVKAPSVGYDPARLLAAEKLMFGAAGEDHQRWGRSKVRLRLDHWNSGTLMPPKGDFIDHRESPIKKVAANTYLGYGPLGANKDRPALDPAKATNQLSLQVQNCTLASEYLSELTQVF